MKYTKNEHFSGLGRQERQRLAQLLDNTKGLITVPQAAQIWTLGRNQTAKILSWYNEKGWLKRIKRGAYIPVPLNSQTSDIVPEEPFVVATELFAPCYIGGANAANYWGLTEQIFIDVAVITTKLVTERIQNIAGTEYKIHTLKSDAFYGLKTVWLGNNQVKISDPSRTIVDMLMFPQFFGGIRFISEVLMNYIQSEYKAIELLTDYLIKANNGAALKRLGFLLEANSCDEPNLIAYCQMNLTQGYAKLNPSQKCPRLIRKWRIGLPESWKEKFDDK